MIARGLRKPLLPLIAVAGSLAGISVALAMEPGVQVFTNVEFLEPGRTEKLDLYLPVAPADGKLRPALVWIHGGGWVAGNKEENRAKQICGTLAAAGYVAVSIDYKLGDGSWPQCVLDCKNAVRFLRANAGKYQIDPQRIAVAGGSTGGYLAQMVGFTVGKDDLEPVQPYPGLSSDVRCVINFYGPSNLLTRLLTDEQGRPTTTRRPNGEQLKVFHATSEDDQILRYASPVTHVSSDSPPVLILQGRADPWVDYPQAEELARVLAERHVPHELLLLDGIGHTFDLTTWNKKPLPIDLRAVLLKFLDQHMGVGKSD